MSDSDKKQSMEELDKAFDLLSKRPVTRTPGHTVALRDDKEWKLTDPEGYKKDMQAMCKEMFGDNWQVEYEAMLKEEFPEEF